VFDRAAKDLRRLRRIVGIVSKYGFGRGAKQSPRLEKALEAVDTEQKVSTEISQPARFRLMLEELGPSFIKLGQVLSSRPDLVSAAYVEELKQLQYQCIPLSYSEIEHAIEDGLGRPVSELFQRVDETPMATASIAQVHRAWTKAGEEVAVKVQRPGIRGEIRADVDILYRIAQLFESVVEESGVADPIAMVREFELAINAELNFEVEAANIREFGRHKTETTDITIPAVHDALSSDTVLTMSFLHGIPFTRLPEGLDRRAVAKRILQEAFEEVFLAGFFHGDPHPGNILLLEDGRYGILDFGLCGRLTPQMRETLVALSLATALKDADSAARTLYRMGQSDSRVSISALRDDLQALYARYLNRRIEDVDSTLMMQEILRLAIRHQIRIPAEYTMLGRAGATIEGLVRSLDPDLDIAVESMPYAQKLMASRMGPENLEGGLSKILLQFQGLSQDLPIQVSQILSDLSAGNLQVNLQGRSVERLNQTLLIATAGISGAILGGSFVIGAFIALSRVDWTMFGIPIVAIFGAMAGATIFAWVSAYVVIWPRLRKIRLSNLLSPRRPKP
jgi:ubiquinone biosynthesis protein